MEITFGVPTINGHAIVKVYSGKPGCGCGCNGKYFEDARNIARVVGLMAEKAHQMTEIDASNGGKIFAVETANRYFWAATEGVWG